MRLLERESNGELSLTKDFENNPPPYAILSHCWEDGQEVSFDEMRQGLGRSKSGYRKIQFCGEQAARDGLRYFWVDTCCINKLDPVELQKSINSMFRWYQNAEKCYVFLLDVRIPYHNPYFEKFFRKARWFTRGWTLQELLAPSSVEFFSADYLKLGDKHSLERHIHERTEIPVEALRGYDPTQFSIDECVSWAERRETKYEEDMAYSLLGIFGVFLPLIYGEGKENAFRRLREEIRKRIGDDGSEKLPSSNADNQPKFTVPFSRDPKFIGREDTMREITSRLHTQHRIALCGVGGIGKSQIAIEFCYAWRDSHPKNHVFWVYASTFDSFEQAFTNIAKEMSISEALDPQKDTLVIVRDWLSNPENGSWLLVLDNADDPELCFGVNAPASSLTNASNHRYISDFLPKKNEKGVVIITTRNKRVGQRFTDREGDIIITPFAAKDAGQLLMSKIPALEKVNHEEVQNLVKILENIPLAITQAAAYIQENTMTVQEYITELNTSDSDLQDYLDEPLSDSRRYPDSENSIIRTWKLSFDQIAKQVPRAASLLSLMVQLDRQGIPKKLLKQKSERGVDFNKAIGTLQAYSLIKTEIGESSFEVHRLIQLSVQRWLSLQHTQTEWQEKALYLMAEAFPSGDYGTWEECEILLLHAKCVARYTFIPKRSILQKADLLMKIASFDREQGRFEAAYLQYNDVLQIRDEILGKTHPVTLVTMSSLALILYRQGKYVEAEIINRQILELKEEMLGKKHPDTLMIMNNLAAVLDSQGKYAEAETINRQTLELKKEVLGKKHPSTLTTMSNLAPVLNKQGKYTEAETINRQTLELKEEVLSKKHPDTLMTMNNLAFVLDKQGKYTEAETMNRQTLELREKVLGKKHPDTLMTMNNLASVLDSQGKYAEAETLSRQTLELREEVLGKKHPSTLVSVHNLAYLLQNKEDYEEASMLYQRACTGYELSLGSEHPTTIACMKHYSIMLDGIKERT